MFWLQVVFPKDFPKSCNKYQVMSRLNVNKKGQRSQLNSSLYKPLCLGCFNQIYQVIIVKPELLIEAFMEIDKLKPVAPKPLLWGAKVLLERD